MAPGELYCDRYSFGFDRLKFYPALVRWRFSDAIFCGLLILIFILNWNYNPGPFQRQFFINDLTISHPFAEHERVPVFALFFASFGIPFAVVTLVSLIFTPRQHKVYVLYVSLLGLFLSLFTTDLITEFLKCWIGRHRPDFLARCVVKEGTPENTMVFAKDVCTTDNIAILLDGFKTTPSGHSSTSFSGLGFLSLWLCGQFLVSHVDTGSWRTIVCGIPAFGACYIALSRTEDYRHHFVDVILGSVLGCIMAWWSYRRIFPKITDDYCYLPYVLIDEEKHDGNTIYRDVEYELTPQHDAEEANGAA
ncbi:hypothetical protein PACTADRAFT_49888 [Pachysolen tannophilus NRRL Y-2460]|uniref:Phosphatidic acid phosphatase type 2/haloperoxidase domain-containing protein n=1 Tax=Pachysolen tannophilus NRRL Y-2460 TaxID=669874 RepID=A0A1E4TTT8_PACTA|nr:hypothetical protein PACTADRAFT_49888 [Pachysolen tannophilus NRRL Y-2460]